MKREYLEEARAKVEWANCHIQQLNSAIKGFSETCGYIHRIEDEPQTGEQVVYIKTTTPVPKKIPLLIGDAVHNAKTALDYIAATCAEIEVGT